MLHETGSIVQRLPTVKEVRVRREDSVLVSRAVASARIPFLRSYPLALAVAGLAFCAGLTRGSELDDPFPLRNQLPFNLLFLDQTPVDARLLAPRQVRLAVNIAYESTMVATDDLTGAFRQDDFEMYDGRVSLPVLRAVAEGTPGRSAFILDGETMRVALRLRRGVAPRFELGLEVPLLFHSGGFLDSTIDSYHARFDQPDGGRSAFAQDLFQVGYVGDGEVVFYDRAPNGPGLGDIVVSGRTMLVRGARSRPWVGSSVSLKVPTGSATRLRGSGGWDCGISLQVSQPIGRATVHGGYGYTLLGGWSIAPGVPLNDSRSLYGAYSFAVTPRSSLIAQVLRSTGPFDYRSGSDLGRVAMEFAVGFRHRLPRGLMVDWALIENIDHYLNTPDVGAFLGVSRAADRSLGPGQPSASIQ